MNVWKICTCAVLLSFGVGVAAPAVAADTGTPAGSEAVSLTYRPPLRGAPASRVGGGTRGAGDARLSLEVIAPDHTGLTSVGQPILYWYASEAVAAPLEFTLLAEGAEKPLVERRLPATMDPGVQAIALSSLGATLKPGVEYQWFVSVVTDPTQRSRDVTAGGTIRRTDADAALKASLARADERTAPLVYAESGYFYDAIDGLSRLIARNPNEAGLRTQRAMLLEQVGLTEPARQDRMAAAR
jgi:hypothetical protein